MTVLQRTTLKSANGIVEFPQRLDRRSEWLHIYAA